MKRSICFLLILTMIICLLSSVVVYAASDDATVSAETLYALGLFQGKGTNTDGTPIYDLDSAPTRMEAVTMLVRLLGKENEAKAGTWETPFTDVDDWAKPYVGYAYVNGLTKGTGYSTFGGKSLITATQYLTFVLRALGYDSSTDFQWNAAWELTDKLGITHGEYNTSNNDGFLRGNVAEISVSALPARMKGTDITLAEKLIRDGVFTKEQYDLFYSNKVDCASQGGQMELIWLTEPKSITDFGTGDTIRFCVGSLILVNIEKHVRGSYLTVIDCTEENRVIDGPEGGLFGGGEWHSVTDISLLQYADETFQTGHDYILALELLDENGKKTGDTIEKKISFTEQTLGPAYHTPTNVQWSTDGKPVWNAEKSDLIALNFEARCSAWGNQTRRGYCTERINNGNENTYYQWLLRQTAEFAQKHGPGTEIRFRVRIYGDNLTEHNHSAWSDWSEYLPCEKIAQF